MEELGTPSFGMLRITPKNIWMRSPQGAIVHQLIQSSPASPTLLFTTFSHINAGVSKEIIRYPLPAVPQCLPSIRTAISTTPCQEALPGRWGLFPRGCVTSVQIEIGCTASASLLSCSWGTALTALPLPQTAPTLTA